MPRLKFFGRPDIEQNDGLLPQAAQELLAGDVFQPVGVVDAVRGQRTHLRTVVLGQLAQRAENQLHGAITHAVQHTLSVPLRVHEAGALEVLEML